jgi:peptidoglycan hydrolase-like protein with peptidoglycan-binding domain
MQLNAVAPPAHIRSAVVAVIALAVIAAPAAADAAPAGAREAVAMASAGWHGRAVEDPQPLPRVARAPWPAQWSAGPVARGTGYARPGGSRRVRDLQRRLRQLGYRPGPVDGWFGPRTQAAVTWFQYKHGLRRTGRVNQSTLTILRARSNHTPLPESTRTSGPDAAPEPRGAAEPVVVANGQGSGADLAVLVVAALLALVAGLLVGTRGLDLFRRAPSAQDTPEPAPILATPVFGYVTLGSPLHVDTAVAALATLCGRRGWSLVRIVHDAEPVTGRIADRPGLMYALREIHAGAASGLVVARLQDFTTRFTDLAALVESLTDADAFLAAVGRELDTSTSTGRATADAIIELGSRQHLPTAVTAARFRPPDHDRELGPRLTAMRQRGIPLGAIADALNVARIPTATGHHHWRLADVRAVTHDQRS